MLTPVTAAVVCVVTALSLQLIVCGGEGQLEGLDGEDSSEGFQEWSHYIASEYVTDVDGEHGGKVRDIMETGFQNARREKLQMRLASDDKWHFMVGYTDLKALEVARGIIGGAHIHHYPARKRALQFFGAFITIALAEVLKRNSMLFYVVEPVLPSLKIEDLTLGKLIRGGQNREELDNSRRDPLILKATLAVQALSIREAEILAQLWEVALEQTPPSSLIESQTARYTDGQGQMGIWRDENLKNGHGREETCSSSTEQKGAEELKIWAHHPDERQTMSGVRCEAMAGSAILCSPIAMAAMKEAAYFMAKHAVVQVVELNPRYQVFNKWAKYITQSISGKHLVAFKHGLFGQGEIIGCADTGIDMRHCFFRDSNKSVPYNLVELQSRKVVQYVTSWGDKTDDSEGHGTHVAGSIAGDTEEGGNVFAGMAPAAKLAFFDLGSNSSDLRAPVDLGSGIFNHGFLAGARIFSNSWGVVREGYSSNSHDVDSFSYLNENVLIIFAAGNQGGSGRGTVASPANSKNCLAVGASFNTAKSFFNHKANYKENVRRPSTVAPFSSIGPTRDGRIKPDVVAPGMLVWSSVPNVGYAQDANCKVDGRQGTSSAAPVVAGLAALVRQYFREGYYPSGKKISNDSFEPSGALLKAMIIHSAVPEQWYLNYSGKVHLHKTPDNVQGYGRVVLEKILVFAKLNAKQQSSQLFVLSGRQDDAVISQYGVHTLTLSVLTSKKPFRVTMVWMDPPAAPSSLHPMINDLNLKVQDPSNNTVYPNSRDDFESVNNVEVIHVAKPKAGPWQVVVEGTKVVTEGQPYALVITGHFTSVTKSWGNQPRIMQSSISSATIHKGIIIRPFFRQTFSCALFGMVTWHTFSILLLIIGC